MEKIKEKIITVSSKGQITLPIKLRKELGIRRGVKLLAKLEDKEIKLKAIPALSQLKGIDKEVLEKVDIHSELRKLRLEWEKKLERLLK